MTILAQSDLTANTNNLVLSLAAPATVNILIANRTGNSINISLALVPAGTGSPSTQHWIEYQLALDGNNPLERGGIPLGTGDQIFINPSGPGVSCSVVAINI